MRRNDSRETSVHQTCRQGIVNNRGGRKDSYGAGILHEEILYYLQAFISARTSEPARVIIEPLKATEGSVAVLNSSSDPGYILTAGRSSKGSIHVAAVVDHVDWHADIHVNQTFALGSEGRAEV